MKCFSLYILFVCSYLWSLSHFILSISQLVVFLLFVLFSFQHFSVCQFFLFVAFLLYFEYMFPVFLRIFLIVLLHFSSSCFSYYLSSPPPFQQAVLSLIVTLVLNQQFCQLNVCNCHRPREASRKGGECDG